AIAQAQRLQAETGDPAAKARASDIEATLKRLTRLSERLMQLARAEGGRLRLEQVSDLRPVARILTDELSRTAGADRISLSLPDDPLMSDLDPDVFAILYRNLVENALRHGADGTPIHVSLASDGVLTVANDGPVVPNETLARLADRFERAGKLRDGNGLGLAIVHAIAQRIGSALVLKSPRPGQDSGFEACLTLPTTMSDNHLLIGSGSRFGNSPS
ncbi:MAG TPA: HAMP domain-containing sensor histidine kinase, partial [Hyphomonas sp.]|nr:HAMP domain-containing sensor histidine kinase [Hyphomonas sp.]